MEFPRFKTKREVRIYGFTQVFEGIKLTITHRKCVQSIYLILSKTVNPSKIKINPIWVYFPALILPPQSLYPPLR
jgi:hypothetical protein